MDVVLLIYWSTGIRGLMRGLTTLPQGYQELLIIIIIIRAFVRRTMSASELNLRRRQSLGGEDG